MGLTPQSNMQRTQFPDHRIAAALGLRICPTHTGLSHSTWMISRPIWIRPEGSRLRFSDPLDGFISCLNDSETPATAHISHKVGKRQEYETDWVASTVEKNRPQTRPQVVQSCGHSAAGIILEHSLQDCPIISSHLKRSSAGRIAGIALRLSPVERKSWPTGSQVANGLRRATHDFASTRSG